MTISCDPDARWLKKGNRSYFGYKAFVCADAKHGFILNVDVTPANVSEVRSMELAIGLCVQQDYMPTKAMRVQKIESC